MRAQAVTSSHVPPGGLVVRRPRPSDATGVSLRKAYDGAAGMSPDLLALLRTLDKLD